MIQIMNTVMALVLLALALLVTPSSGQFYRDSPASLLITPPPMTMDNIDPNCENFTRGNWRIQEFYTPNYPGEYLNNTDCVSYLEAPPGFRIQLDFRDKFILEKSEGCKYDYLEVRDGPFAYSPPIGRYCNAEFPPIIKSSGRFLCMRFKTDDLLQYGGFRAVYSYLKDHTQNDGAAVSKVTPKTCRIPVKLSVDAADGVLSSDDIPYGDVSDPKYPKGHSVDCTWELYTDSTHGINLRSTELNLKNRKRCDTNNVTIYERTTLESSIKEEYCRGNNRIVDMMSDSNRVFVRIYGSTLNSKPEVKMIYSMVRKGKCSKPEMKCGDVCLPRTLICNGVVNCKDRSDEKGCSRIRPSLGRKPGGEDGDDVDSDVIGATGSDDADSDGSVHAATPSPTPSPTTTPAPIVRTDFECSFQTLDVFIPVSVAPHSTMVMKDPKCELQNNGTHFVISFAYSECDTDITKSDDYDIAENEIFVKAKRDDKDGVVFDMDFSIPLSCKVPNEPFRTISGGFKIVPRQQLVERNMDEPLPTFELRVFTDAEYQKNPAEQGLTEVVANRELYIEIAAVNGTSQGKGIKVHQCIATPTEDNSQAEQGTHLLLRDGCPTSKAVTLQPNPDTRTFRFSVRAFYFDQSDKDERAVYVHCDVTTGQNPKTCLGTRRRRRRAETRPSMTLSSGPHILANGA